MGQVISASELSKVLGGVRSEGKRIVFTNGCFDILHVGHIRYLQEAKKLGEYLFVGINSDASVKRLKGESRPIQSEQDRLEILAALESVDGVTLFDQDTPIELIKLVKPDILVKGGDWKKEQIVGWDFVESYGGSVQSLSFHDGRSTTEILSRAR